MIKQYLLDKTFVCLCYLIPSPTAVSNLSPCPRNCPQCCYLQDGDLILFMYWNEVPLALKYCFRLLHSFEYIHTYKDGTVILGNFYPVKLRIHPTILSWLQYKDSAKMPREHQANSAHSGRINKERHPRAVIFRRILRERNGGRLWTPYSDMIHKPLSSGFLPPALPLLTL